MGRLAMGRLGVLAVGTLVAGAGALGLLLPERNVTSAQTQPAARAHTVTATTVVNKPMPVALTALGRIEPIAAVAIKPRIDGTISEVAVAEGQTVQAGQVLLRLDDRQALAMVSQARGALLRDQAQLDQAKRELERLTSLSQKDFASRSALDRAASTVESLTGTVVADQGALDNAQAQLSFTTITAPIAGRIGSINTKLGNTVRAADPAVLLSINQMNPIYASFAVPQTEALALRDAMTAGTTAVQILAGRERGVSGQAAPNIAGFAGTIAFIENEIDAGTNTLGVKAVVENPDERLWPGEFVDVKVTLRVEPNAVVVPEEAVQLSQAGTYVFVIQPDSTVAFRPVEIAWSAAGEAVIRAGLTAGEQVVLSGQMPLENGSKVAVHADDAAAPSASAQSAGPAL